MPLYALFRAYEALTQHSEIDFIRKGVDGDPWASDRQQNIELVWSLRLKLKLSHAICVFAICAICFMYYGHLFCVAQILLSKPVEWIKGMTNLPERMKTSIYVLFQFNNNSRCTIHTVQNYTHFKSYLLEKLQMVSPWTLCQ